MKIGRKILFTNGRGNCKPWNLYLHGKKNHGLNSHDCCRKGLNSKIRRLAKEEIQKEISET